jgi:multiple sugar transport system substrate-binding protein
MMKKRLLCLGLTLIVSSLLTGCHGNKGLEPFSVPESFDETKQYEITFWAKNDTNVTQAEIYKSAIASFEKIYPNIKVNMRLYTDYSRIYNDVITNISTQTTPNVCITYPDHIATYLTGSNVVVPLDELFTDENFGFGKSQVKFDAPTYDEVVPKFLEECKLNDHYYAVPYMRSTEALYINEDLVKALGYEVPENVSWDFIWEVSEAAMETDSEGTFKVNGQKVMIPFIYKSTDNYMIQMLKQMGAGYSDTDGNIEIFNDDTKNFLFEISKHAKTGAFSTFKISSYPGNFLNANQCIFAIDSTAGATWMGPHAVHHDISEDKLTEFNLLVRPIPQLDPKNPKMISQGPSICIFNKKDQGEVLASWLFTQYLLSNETQIAYSQTEGYLPVTSKAFDSLEYQDYLSREGEDNDLYYAPKIQASKLLLENIDNTFITPVFNGSASLRDAAGQMIENVTKSERRKETVNDEYITKMYKDIQSLYHLDQVQKANTETFEKKEFGKLPTASKVLLYTLVLVWIAIIGYWLFSKKMSKSVKNNDK